MSPKKNLRKKYKNEFHASSVKANLLPFPILPGTWLRYRPASSPEFNDLSTMSRGVGYWIHATEPCLLKVSGVPVQSTSITLYAGWNLVGYSSMTEETVANSLWGTSADRVEVHDAGSPYLISAVDSTYPMKPGQGYWVRVPADAVWVVDW